MTYSEIIKRIATALSNARAQGLTPSEIQLDPHEAATLGFNPMHEYPGKLMGVEVRVLRIYEDD